MNIFFLDKTPEKSAEYLCDKHVPKMLLESAQMLSTAVQYHAGEIKELYKPAYENHPMTKWVRFNRDNFNWALENAMWIDEEYQLRFKRKHKSGCIVQRIIDEDYYKEITDGFFSEPPQCMPDEYRDKDYVNAYRKYYIGAKSYFAKWKRGRQQPDWWQ